MNQTESTHVRFDTALFQRRHAGDITPIMKAAIMGSVFFLLLFSGRQVLKKTQRPLEALYASSNLTHEGLLVQVGDACFGVAPMLERQQVGRACF